MREPAGGPPDGGPLAGIPPVEKNMFGAGIVYGLILGAFWGAMVGLLMGPAIGIGVGLVAGGYGAFSFWRDAVGMMGEDDV